MQLFVWQDTGCYTLHSCRALVVSKSCPYKVCVPEPTPSSQLPFNSGSSFFRLVEHIEPLDSLTNSHVPSCAMLRSGQPLSGCNGAHGSCSPFSRARWLLIGGAARPRPLQAQHHCTFDIFFMSLVHTGFSQLWIQPVRFPRLPQTSAPSPRKVPHD